MEKETQKATPAPGPGAGQGKPAAPGIYLKILRVMEQVQYLKKDDTINTGGQGSYKGISEEKVTEEVRKALIANRLIIYPAEQIHTRTDTPVTNDKGKIQINRLATVDTRYRIVDCDTGEWIETVSSGTGVDTQDKAVGKAMTYAYKYMILRTFAIPTGEDPDKIASAQTDQSQNVIGPAKQTQQHQPISAPEFMTPERIRILTTMLNSSILPDDQIAAAKVKLSALSEVGFNKTYQYLKENQIITDEHTA